MLSSFIYMWTEDAVLPSKEKIPLVILFLYIHIVCLYYNNRGVTPAKGYWIDRPEPGHSLPFSGCRVKSWTWSLGVWTQDVTITPLCHIGRDRNIPRHALRPLKVSPCCTSLRGVGSSVLLSPRVRRAPQDELENKIMLCCCIIPFHNFSQSFLTLRSNIRSKFKHNFAVDINGILHHFKPSTI